MLSCRFSDTTVPVDYNKDIIFKYFEPLKNCEEDTREEINDYTFGCSHQTFFVIYNTLYTSSLKVLTPDAIQAAVVASKEGCHEFVEAFICEMKIVLREMTMQDADNLMSKFALFDSNLLFTRKPFTKKHSLISWFKIQMSDVIDWQVCEDPSDEVKLFGIPFTWDILYRLIDERTIYVLYHTSGQVAEWYDSEGEKAMKKKYVMKEGGLKVSRSTVGGALHSFLDEETGKRLPSVSRIYKDNLEKQYHHMGVLHRDPKEGPAIQDKDGWSYYMYGNKVNGICKRTGIALPHLLSYGYDDITEVERIFVYDPLNKVLPYHCECRESSIGFVSSCFHSMKCHYDAKRIINRYGKMSNEYITEICKLVIDKPGYMLLRPMYEIIYTLYLDLTVYDHQNDVNKSLKDKARSIIKSYLGKEEPNPDNW